MIEVTVTPDQFVILAEDGLNVAEFQTTTEAREWLRKQAAQMEDEARRLISEAEAAREAAEQFLAAREQILA